MNTRLSRLLVILAVSLSGLLAIPARAADEAADALIKRLSSDVLDSIRNDLLCNSPRYVVARGAKAPRGKDWDFFWTPLYQAVTNRYDLRQTIGSYDVWQRSDHP